MRSTGAGCVAAPPCYDLWACAGRWFNRSVALLQGRPLALLHLPPNLRPCLLHSYLPYPSVHGILLLPPPIAAPIRSLVVWEPFYPSCTPTPRVRPGCSRFPKANVRLSFFLFGLHVPVTFALSRLEFFFLLLHPARYDIQFSRSLDVVWPFLQTSNASLFRPTLLEIL